MAAAETLTSIKEVIPDLGDHLKLDPAVLKVLPSGCNVLEAVTFGTAAWTRAIRVDVALHDGTAKSYFLKCASEDQGRRMMNGEFASMSAIAQYLPEFVPRPCAWGQFERGPADTYFFLLEFVDIATGAPEPKLFCSQLARLHTESVSPTGKFGFHEISCHGPNWQNTEWHDSWSAYFTRLLDQFFYRDVEHNGHNESYEEQYETLKNVTIPRILEPLQSEGRVLKPSLIHGDLWEENCGTDLHSGQPVVFDAAAHYAHNEFDLGMWRRDIVRFGKAHVRQYLRLVPPSEPREQWDDRHRLYSIKYDLAHSIALPETCEAQRKL
ncbi:hypothetical protein LTR70_010576 [Exophiala xenobiotica]|nr:hypothetical protein LTR70_010576 [Exophiala xenobiotica]